MEKVFTFKDTVTMTLDLLTPYISAIPLLNYSLKFKG